MILELLQANVAFIIPFLMGLGVIALSKFAAKTESSLDDKMVDLLKKNEKAITDKAIKLVKEKIDQAIARKKKK